MNGITTAQERQGPLLQVPQYEELRLRVKQAAIDMGLDRKIDDLDTWSAKFVIAADGAEQWGLKVTWYMARHPYIREHEGGRSAIVETIASLALGLMKEDPTLYWDDAVMEAGHEWRASIRPQWDYRSGNRQAFSIEGMVENVRRSDGAKLADSAELYVHQSIGLSVDHPAAIEDPPDERIPQLREAMSSLSDTERKVVDLRSGGMSYQEIADELGWHGRQSAHAAFKRACKKLKAQMEGEAA